jgi:DNA-binding SARP family transcriptional activator
MGDDRTGVTGWQLTLLGGFELRSATGHAVPVNGRKAIALLSFLALQPNQRASRGRLIALLWSDVPDAQARTNLRQALATARRALKGLLATDGDIVALAPGVLSTDVAAFDAALASGSTAALERAAGLYRGELLDGVALPGADFASWLSVERERLRADAIGALGRLLDKALADGEAEAGVRTALRLIALDPLQERAHRVLMRLYARQGRHSVALKQYETLHALLQRELGVAPDAETAQLRREIRESRQRATPAVPRPITADVNPIPAPDESVESTIAPAAAPGGELRAALERRQVTVLACELVGAVERLAAGDPEAAHDLIVVWRRASAELAARYGGTVIESLADTLLIGFGFPKAHEDDAERSVRTAIGLIEQAPAVLPGHELRLRVGVATSLVVIGVGAEAAGDGHAVDHRRGRWSGPWPDDPGVARRGDHRFWHAASLWRCLQLRGTGNATSPGFGAADRGMARARRKWRGRPLRRHADGRTHDLCGPRGGN